MERLKELNRFQKAVLLLLAAMAAVFGVVYAGTIGRMGFLYEDVILIPESVGTDTVYSGKVQGSQAAFTVTADKAVRFRWGEKDYGTYTAVEDPTALPEKEENDLTEFMTGVEIRRDGALFFRGGVFQNGDYLMLCDEDGSWVSFGVFATMNDGTVIDGDGNVVDMMAPEAGTILELMDGPELTHKGSWAAWLGGVLLSIITALSILFADELFRWNLSFQIRNAHRAEPSEWEIMGRYVSWVAIPIMVLVLYIIGLS